jgi:hypothetical protein
MFMSSRRWFAAVAVAGACFATAAPARADDATTDPASDAARPSGTITTPVTIGTDSYGKAIVPDSYGKAIVPDSYGKADQTDSYGKADDPASTTTGGGS